MRSFLNRVLAPVGSAIVSLLGFVGCGFVTRPQSEYGCPTVDFKVDITAVDTEGNGIKGINVIPAEDDGTSVMTTDESGNVQEVYIQIGDAPKKYKIYFEDPDQERSGGSFVRDSAEFVTTQTGKGDSHWYWGEWTAKGTKVLKKGSL